MEGQRNQAKVDLPKGHSATLERTETGATLMIRNPDGDPTIEVEIQMTEQGPALRKRSWSARKRASTASSVPPVLESAEPRLSIQQYASLRAECVTAPTGRLDEVRKRYGLDEPSDEAESKLWAKKFAQDPALFETYKRLFQQFRATPPAGARPPQAVMTQSLVRILTLGEHATMAAELRFLPEQEVYAKYDLTDTTVRAEVLRMCEERLQKPTDMDTWKKLHALAIEKLEAGHGRAGARSPDFGRDRGRG
jgi:hypothetical protein